jgi:DNA excision repair protein ERCC-4
MLTDAAHIIFETARRRCYTVSSTSAKSVAPVIDLVDDEDAWDALNEAEGIQVDKKGKGKEKEDGRPHWLPAGLDPVLEELPKWDLLTQVLDEIEEEIVKTETMRKSGRTSSYIFRILLSNCSPATVGSDTVLIMASSTRTCNLITDFLSSHNPTGKKGAKGRDMMMQKLRVYLWWKEKLSQRKEEGKSAFHLPDAGSTAASIKDPRGTGLSEALRKKDKEKAERNQSRRRVRGGAPAAASDSGRTAAKSSAGKSSAPAEAEADVLAELYVLMFHPYFAR